MQWLRGRTTGVTELAVSPDSRYVAAGMTGCDVWDLHAKRTRRARPTRGLARGLSFATPTVLLLGVGMSHVWTLYDAATGSLTPVSGGWMESVAARAPDGLLKLSSYNPDCADPIDNPEFQVTTGRVAGGTFEATADPKAAPHRFAPLAFQPGGARYLASADSDDDDSYGLYDADTDELAVAFAVPRNRSVVQTVFSPDGDRLFLRHAFGIDGYDCAAGGGPVVALAWPDPAKPRYYGQLALYPAGRLAATAEGAGGVTFRDAETLEVLRVYDFAMPRVNAVAFTPDGTRVVIGGSRGKVFVFDVDD